MRPRKTASESGSRPESAEDEEDERGKEEIFLAELDRSEGRERPRWETTGLGFPVDVRYTGLDILHADAEGTTLPNVMRRMPMEEMARQIMEGLYPFQS